MDEDLDEDVDKAFWFNQTSFLTFPDKWGCYSIRLPRRRQGGAATPKPPAGACRQPGYAINFWSKLIVQKCHISPVAMAEITTALLVHGLMQGWESEFLDNN